MPPVRIESSYTKKTSTPTQTPYHPPGSNEDGDVKPDLRDSNFHGTINAKSSEEKKKKRASTAGRTWTPEEKITLLSIADKMGSSVKNFEGVIEGRTGKQCLDTWKNTILPSLKRSLGGV